MTVPTLRIVVDGDSNRVYRRGDKVTGNISLAVEEKEEIESLKVIFAGSCVTKTSRPLHVNTKIDTPAQRHDYEEKIRLFNREKELVSCRTLEPRKYSWDFEFVFPESTEPHFKRMAHGSNYLREPHPLPPSFHLKTSVPGGAAQISYFVQARLVISGSMDTKRCKHTLRYHPRSEVDVPQRAEATSSVLYTQAWKPHKEKEESRVKKVFSGVSMNSTPRIVPTLFHPEKVAPGQHMPLSLSLLNARDPANHAERECIIDSLTVTISTYSTTMCGHTIMDPEDVVSKHITCISRTDMNKRIPFNKTTTLTSNFRLIDDTECVPTFKTYSITRRYALGISIGIKYNDQQFTIRSNTALMILPRTPRDRLPPLQLEDGEDLEPLPQYTPREPSREFAPDYESLYALSPVGSRSSSLFSGGSTPSSTASTPQTEVDQPTYERVVV
ncbi:hypothetical protein ACET3X_009736 [Alternaria dauci]|uniref:Arrestin-like N-terminal domain-containing protein n=1 Tax=Alternaria dauci TaxID=48095 RepID=A0ABR3U6A0_9PLEO